MGDMSNKTDLSRSWMDDLDLSEYDDDLNEEESAFDFSSYANYKSYILSKGIVEVEYSNFSGNSPIKENVS